MPMNCECGRREELPVSCEGAGAERLLVSCDDICRSELSMGSDGIEQKENQRKEIKSKTSIRVCVFCETWMSGGIESFLCNVLTRMDPSQIELDLVVSRIEVSVFTKALLECGARFFELSGDQRRVAENHRRFRELVQKQHYDVLYLNACHGLSMAFLRIAKHEGIPVRIAHSHNTALRKSLTRPLKLVIHNLSKRRYTKDATELWACSRIAAEFMFDRGVMKERGFKFIPNGIDVERFCFNQEVRETIRKELGLVGCFVIGNVGRLCYQKNQTFLLDVLAEVLKHCPDSRMLLVGEGEEKPTLTEKARKLGISDKVIFYGTVDCVERLLWAMDAFVFPSRFEGFGIAAVEAQAAGLPVICSDIVPVEAYVTTHIRSLPLAAGTVAWAKELLKVQRCLHAGADEIDRSEAVGPSGDRDSINVGTDVLSSVDEVRAAGFDVGKISEEIEQCFRRAVGNISEASSQMRNEVGSQKDDGHLNQVRRKLYRNLRSCYCGWLRWHRVIKSAGVNKDTAVILLPSCDRQINRLALLYLDDMLKNRKYKDAIILTHDTVVMKCTEIFSMNIAKVVPFSREDAEYLMQLYCLYEFDKRLVVAALDEPNGRNGSALIGKRGMTLEEIFAIGVYRISPFVKRFLPVYTGEDDEIKAFLSK